MSVTRGLRILAGMLMSSLPVLAVAPAPPVSYRIEARLDAAKKIVSGSEILSWTNYAPDPVDRLPFHLYPGARRMHRDPPGHRRVRRPDELDAVRSARRRQSP
jgi:hypothetical protein